MKKILVIDDSRTVRQQVMSVLNTAGYEVLGAEDGIDALFKMTRHQDLSLVICDVNMPKMGGLEMLEKIAEHGSRGVPVIMLTTEGRAEMIDRAKKAGAKGWFVKPFKPHLLLAAVTKIVETPSVAKLA